MARKRLFDDLSEIETSDLHCAIQSVKKSQYGCNYYTGVATDGNKKVQQVGFDERSQAKLSTFHKSRDAVKIQSCNIKRNYSDELEIVIGRSTVIRKSFMLVMILKKQQLK